MSDAQAALNAPILPVVKAKAAVAVVAEYADLKVTAAATEARLKVLKPIIEAELDKLDADAAVFGNRVVTRSHVAPLLPTPSWTVTKADIGRLVPGKSGRAGYAQLSVQ